MRSPRSFIGQLGRAGSRRAPGAGTGGRARRRARPAPAFALALAILAGAVLATPAHGQERPDRSRRPEPGPVPALRLPPVQEFTLSNGLRVLLVDKHDLPLVQVNLHLRAGSVRDEAGRTGLASLTADMLDEGAAGRSALEIADAVEMLGARLATGAGMHSAVVSLRVPVARLEPALALMGDVALRPDFPEAELDRLRKERLTALLRQRDEPAAIAAELFNRTLFGETHPYGRSATGDEASLLAITTADLRAFHRTFYRPNNATLIVVGAVRAETLRPRLEAVFGGWDAGDVPAERVEAAPQVRGRTVHLVDKPGAAQSIILIGRIGAARTSEDYHTLEVMNTILGGSFTSRLNRNLREEKGYTYGARSSFDFLPVPGAFHAGAAVQTNATGPALHEFMKELRAIRDPIPDEELTRARSFLAMRYPAGFQSVAGIAARIADLVQYGIPTDELGRYTERVLGVERPHVERVAREYIDPDNIAIIVVGDRAAIESQIRELELGEIRFLTVTDVFGEPPAGAQE